MDISTGWPSLISTHGYIHGYPYPRQHCILDVVSCAIATCNTLQCWNACSYRSVLRAKIASNSCTWNYGIIQPSEILFFYAAAASVLLVHTIHIHSPSPLVRFFSSRVKPRSSVGEVRSCCYRIERRDLCVVGFFRRTKMSLSTYIFAAASTKRFLL